MNKKRLIFKKGINTIIFPVYMPVVDCNFADEALNQIRRIRTMFLPRNNVIWNYIAEYNQVIAKVIVTKVIRKYKK